MNQIIYCHMMWYFIWCDMRWCDMRWCDMRWCDMIWCDMIWCDDGTHISYPPENCPMSAFLTLAIQIGPYHPRWLILTHFPTNPTVRPVLDTDFPWVLDVLLRTKDSQKTRVCLDLLKIYTYDMHVMHFLVGGWTNPGSFPHKFRGENSKHIWVATT